MKARRAVARYLRTGRPVGRILMMLEADRYCRRVRHDALVAHAGHHVPQPLPLVTCQLSNDVARGGARATLCPMCGRAVWRYSGARYAPRGYCSDECEERSRQQTRRVICGPPSSLRP